MLLCIGLSVIPCTGMMLSYNNFALDYMSYNHDVGIKNITKPSGYFGDNIWVFFHRHYHPRNWSITYENQFEAAIRITKSEIGDYGGWNLSTVKFFHDTNYSETHTGFIKIYGPGKPTSPGPLITLEPFNVTGEGWFKINLSNPITLDGEQDVWISVEANCSIFELPVGNDEKSAIKGKGDWINISESWKELTDLGIDRNWCIKAGIKPQDQDILFLQSGVQAVEAIVKNYGSYNETNLSVTAKIFYNETIVYHDNVTINQLNSGNETTVYFNNWNFAYESVYLLEINVSLDTDEYPNNNIKSMFIGVDDTPPITIHFFDPPMSEWINYGIGSYINITIVAIDFLSDVKEIQYGINGGPHFILGDYVTVIFELVESLIIQYLAVDNVGNVESTNEFFFDLDLTPPVIAEIQWDTYKKGGFWYVDFTTSATDATSGMDRVEMYLNNGLHQIINGSGPDYVFTLQWSEAFRKHTFWFYHFDKAGNVAIASLNGSIIEPYPYVKSYNMLFLRQLKNFQILPKILDILMLYST